jgi:hypothetical protein
MLSVLGRQSAPPSGRFPPTSPAYSAVLFQADTSQSTSRIYNGLPVLEARMSKWGEWWADVKATIWWMAISVIAPSYSRSQCARLGSFSQSHDCYGQAKTATRRTNDARQYAPRRHARPQSATIRRIKGMKSGRPRSVVGLFSRCLGRQI